MGFSSSQETKPTADGDKGKHTYSCYSLIFILPFNDKPRPVSLRNQLFINRYPLMDILACLTSALLHLASPKQEEKKSPQGKQTPAQGQDKHPKMRKRRGFLERWDYPLYTPGSRFTTSPSCLYSLLDFFFCGISLLPLFHCTLILPLFSCSHWDDCVIIWIIFSFHPLFIALYIFSDGPVFFFF